MNGFGLISPAHAQDAGATALGGSDFLIQLLPLLIIFVVFYFLLIRPQQKRLKEHQSMIGALRRGDRVVTAGGLIGTIAKVVNDEEVEIDLAQNVRVRAMRATIANVLSKTEPARGGETGGEAEAKPKLTKN